MTTPDSPDEVHRSDLPATKVTAPAANVTAPAANVTAPAAAGSDPATEIVAPPGDQAASDPPTEAVTGQEPAESDSEPTPAATRWQQIVERRKTKKQRPFWVELPILIVVAFALTFLIQTFVAKVYYIPSGSMETTLHGDTAGGDRVLVNKVIYDFTDPAPGDVVVFRGPETWTPDVVLSGPTTWYGKTFQALGAVVGIAPPDEKDFVKRVIATGGQTVMCCDAAGSVTVDGKALVEPYIYQNFPFEAGVSDCTTEQKSSRCFGPYTVPDGKLWMMGDHRSESADSAYYCRGLDQPPPIESCRGPISVDDVIGKAAFVVMPVSRWQVIDDPDIQEGP